MRLKQSELELKTPEHIISLATSGMLISCDVNVWSATKQDRVISNEVTTNKKAQAEAGRFVKNLLAGNKQHKDIINYRQAIYNWQKRKTFRWNNAQDYLLSVDLESFMEEWHKHKAEFDRLVDNFCMNYDTIRGSMAFAQGDMYDRADYPPVEEVRRKFGCELYVSEVPEGDPRCQISYDLANDLRDNLSRQHKEKVNSILSQQIGRLTEVMQSISHCCTSHKVKLKDGTVKEKKRKIYDETLQKAKDYCKSYANYDLADNEDNKKLKSAIKLLDDTLNGVDSHTLRESDVVREQVKSNVDEILSKFDF